MSLTLELVTFRVREAYEANYIAANAVVNDWLARQPGYISRHLSRTRDGQWIDAILWQSNSAAWAAAENVMKEIGESEAKHAINPDTVTVSRAQVAMTHVAAGAVAIQSDAA